MSNDYGSSIEDVIVEHSLQSRVIYPSQWVKSFSPHITTSILLIPDHMMQHRMSIDYWLLMHVIRDADILLQQKCYTTFCYQKNVTS